MDIEFHYWLTGLIAKRAGFTNKEAQTIASTSQFVDENDVLLKIQSKQGGRPYRNQISQTMNILKPKMDLMRIYPIFHFIPGEPDAPTAQRRDGKMHLLNTTPNNGNANEIMDAAFKASSDIRLYRIGIATHGFIDTWAHQNFIGWFDYCNNIGLDIKPDIGHVDAEHQPDWVSHKWVDNRLVEPDVNNKLRFLSASKALFNKYRHYIKTRRKVTPAPKWKDLEKELDTLMGPTFSGHRNRYRDDRLKRYKQVLKWQDYDELRWFNQAIKTAVHGAKDSYKGILARFTLFQDEYFWRKDVEKEKTHWYRFQEAVKEQEKVAVKLLLPTFAKMGIDLGSS